MSGEGTLAQVLEGTARWCVVNADCRDVFPVLPDGLCVVSDPPYGMDWKTPVSPRRPKGGAVVAGDAESFDPEPVMRFEIGCLFGANHYAANLHSSPGWIVWDKRCGLMPSNDQSDAELAWAPLLGRVRTIRYLWNGGGSLLAENGPERSIFPTQKPVAVMLEVLRLLPHRNIILDPYAGSGTTGVAALRLGRRAILIEIDPKWAELCRERMRIEESDTTLAASRSGQEPLFK